ncbi:hypothetical protein MMC30_009264 [Trapelia coarctata]|nr:hypothetical protein [Trapelia coarctata]
MPPKPLPSQLRIGIDICHISRVGRALEGLSKAGRLEKWAGKIFNRHEWPGFCVKHEQWKKETTGEYGIDIFSQWLAGRWAAKEAAIKAHSNRRLLRHDVSILPPSLGDLEVSGKMTKPLILIDPPRRIVKMDIETAIARGLQEAALYRKMSIGDTLSRYDEVPPGEDTSTIPPLSCRESGSRHIIHRRLLVKEEDKQLADLSISHDGEYAIAVCMALDEASDEHPEPVIDDGTGETIHEPEWGDEGFGTKSKRRK